MTAASYWHTEEDFLALARAEDDPQTRPLMEALRTRQQELRERLEAAPCRSDDLLKDCGGLVCELRGVGFLLRLARDCKGVLARAGDGGPP